MNSFELKDKSTVYVTCNWESNVPEKTIEDAVSISIQKEEEIENKDDINDIIDIKKTTNFVKPEKNPEKPCLRFKIPDFELVYFNAVTLLCDAEIIEIFGDHNIYTGTIHGKVIEKDEDFVVYEYKIDLSKKVNKEISVSLVKLSHQNHFWIYGILLKLKKLSSENKFSSIRYENVDDLINGAQISDQATKCLKFLKETSANPKLNALKGYNLFSETQNSTVESAESQMFQMLKQYIDYKFQVLTELLIMRERNMNDKIDIILEYIKKQHNRYSS